jgi:Ion channel
MGYRNVGYYIGGVADWTEHGGAVEKLEKKPVAPVGVSTNSGRPSGVRRWAIGLELLAQRSLEQLIGFWVALIICFGFVYWIAGLSMGSGLKSGDAMVHTDLAGLGSAIYFSFVTALSIGYGDIIPVGPLRIVAVIEGIAGLLVFGCVISKLVSRRQEELTEEIHHTTFEERLDRVRTNLHLVFSDLGTVQQLQAENGPVGDQIVRRLESTVRVFRGELHTIHDLLYRSRVAPDEESLESLLANLLICLQSLAELKTRANQEYARSAALLAGLNAISRLAREICGECVPQQYAPALKESMDQIKEWALRLG